MLVKQAQSSAPPATERQEAPPLENAKYDIDLMIVNTRGRLLVICDMHGSDLREVLLPPGQVRELTGSSLVMKTAIASDMDRLFDNVRGRLVGLCPIENADGTTSKEIGEIKAAVDKYRAVMIDTCYMYSKNLSNYLKFVKLVTSNGGLVGEEKGEPGSRPVRVIGLDDGKSVMREVLFQNMFLLKNAIDKILDGMR